MRTKKVANVTPKFAFFLLRILIVYCGVMNLFFVAACAAVTPYCIALREMTKNMPCL